MTYTALAPGVVAVLGAAAIDLVARVDSFPPPDGIVIADGYQVTPGGSGGNVAEAVARLGCPARFLGTLGDDEYGNLLLSAFKNAGVDTSAVIIKQGERSAACFIAVNSQGERLIFSLGGCALIDDPALLQPHWLQDIAILYIADALPPVALSAIEQLPPDARVIFCPGGLMVSTGLAGIRPILARAHVVIANQIEATALTGENDPRDAVRRLALIGPGVAIITLGKNGALMYQAGAVQQYTATTVEQVVDTTGAGDAFSAGVIAGMLQGMDWHTTMQLAGEAAANKISQPGSRAGFPGGGLARLLVGIQPDREL